MGRESLKQNLPFLNETLRALATLNVALLGRSFVLLEERTVGAWAKAGAAACFLFSLGLSFAGMLPYADAVHLMRPNVVAKHKAGALTAKRKCLTAAAFALWVGFFVALVGLVVQTLSGQPL